MKAQTYIEVSLGRRRSGKTNAAEAFEFFLRHGVPHEEIVISEHKSRIKVCWYTKKQASLHRLEKALGQLAKSGWTYEKKVLRPDDWLHKWKQTYRIAPLGKKFAVVPVWDREKYRGSRIPLLIDPGAAFGSGNHETTRLMIRLMEAMEGRFRSFYDAGTGTGILAAAAFHLGARRIAGIDIDAGSIKTARRNLRLNGVRNAVLKSGDMKAMKLPGRYDLTAANMISRTLTDLKKRLAALTAPGGYVLVSGIALRNLSGFLRDFRVPELKRLKVVRGRSWAACLYRKS